MKNHTLLFAALCISLATPLAVSAQDSEDPREDFAFGMKAGLNYSNVWDEEGQEFDADGRIGFAGGIYFGIPIGKFAGIQPEVLVSQKGFQASGMLFGSPYSYSKTTTYLDIPIYFQVKPAEFLSIVAGPQYSFLFHEKNSYTYGDNTSAQEQEFENENIRKNIFGFSAGADVIINHVIVSGRMGWDLQKNHGDGTSSTPRYKNQWLQFTVGFQI
jgi:hypothetical protein